MQRLKTMGWLAFITATGIALGWLVAMAGRELVAGHVESALAKFVVALYLGWVVATAARHVRGVMTWVAGCFGYVREDHHPDLL